MYFPILRGRQFELIALRELVESNLIGKRIVPIIEPVKPTSTLISTLVSFRKIMAPVAVIRNPHVGDMITELNNAANNALREKFFAEIDKNAFISTFYIDNEDGISKFSLAQKNITPKESIAICKDKDSLTKYSSIYNNEGALYTLIYDDRSLRRAISGNKVILSDNFKRKERNTEYLQKVDEVFTEDNVYYTDEGYVGFSDYSIICLAHPGSCYSLSDMVSLLNQKQK